MALSTVKPGQKVDGRTVRQHVPNVESIEATLLLHVRLPGIREVPMEAFDRLYVQSITMDGLDDRTARLAREIEESEELNPLIVAFDEQGAYILEGGHRFDALIASGAQALPALVAIDLASPPTLEMAQTLQTIRRAKEAAESVPSATSAPRP